MKKTFSAAALVALLSIAANANAFWWPGGGWSPWGNGFDNGWFGDGWFDFNFSVSTRASGWGHYHNYYAPYWGYPHAGYAHPYVVAPVAPASAEDK